MTLYDDLAPVREAVADAKSWVNRFVAKHWVGLHVAMAVLAMAFLAGLAITALAG